MASAEPAAAPKNPALIVLGAIALFLAVIGTSAFVFLAPRGERIGALDLRAAEPSLEVALQGGDTLSFRLDATVGTESGYPGSSRSRVNLVDEQLGTSAIEVTLMQDGQRVASTRCSAYDGKVTTGSSTDTEVTRSGLPLTCQLVASKAGKHSLAASVTWTPADVREAMLTVHRERAGD